MDIINALGLPRDIIDGTALITLIGQRELVIENFKSIVEYNDIFIRIKTRKATVDIHGKHLLIKSYNSDEIHISGFIKEICYV